MGDSKKSEILVCVLKMYLLGTLQYLIILGKQRNIWQLGLQYF